MLFAVVCWDTQSFALEESDVFDFIAKIWGWLLSFWKDLSPEAKEKIINLAVEAFESIFRSFFKSQEVEKAKEGEPAK